MPRWAGIGGKLSIDGWVVPGDERGSIKCGGHWVMVRGGDICARGRGWLRLPPGLLMLGC